MKFISNKHTKSVFAVFAQTSEEIFGLRSWVEFDTTKHVTVIGWRVRCVQADTAEADVLNFLHVMSKKYTHIAWAGGGAEHASFAGQIATAGLLAPSSIKPALLDSDVIAKLYDRIIKDLKLNDGEYMGFDEFKALFVYFIDEQFPTVDKPNALVLQFPGTAEAAEVKASQMQAEEDITKPEVGL